MKRLLTLCLLATFALTCKAQDSLYTRKVLRFLCGKKCFGRGYLRNGLANAEHYLVDEMKKAGAIPFSGESYTQPFTHPVNTFPRNCRVRINGKKLKAGADFIPGPSSKSIKGSFRLTKTDSVTFVSPEAPVSVITRKKLTFSVALQQSAGSLIEVNRKCLSSDPEKIKIRIKARQVAAFTSRNIIATVKGTGSDSMLVFTAHYDHLGGIGRSVFFPGANDNASGVSMVLNLARHYAKNPSRYDCVFIFFAAEEAGLIGSAHLVKSGLIDLKKIRFLINLDLLGTGDEGIMVVNGAVHEKQFERLVLINNKEHLVKDIRKRGRAANSDHYHFSETGVPAFFIYTLGGTTAYHDVKDVEKDLPLTDYRDVFNLILRFSETL